MAPRKLGSHGHPWLVVDVQWSPFAARDYWVASTANHNCLIWNLNLRDGSATGAIEHSLHGHSRAITDINFSAHHPDILATCSVDGYVHYWDLRKPKQPVLTFCDWFAGATQVKFNRQDPNVLGSAHDRWLHIWDERKAAEPLRSISAHTSKIYGLDWNRTRKTGLVTCSLDKSIKFWDYGNEDDVPERVIRTEFPVWRARHTPFGWGLLAMPQTEPGRLYLYDRRTDSETPLDGPVEPVAIFSGHGDHKVKEFLWRSRGNVTEEADERDFQLISWGEDNMLKLQPLHLAQLEAVGYVKGGLPRKNMAITRKGATYKTFRTVDDHILRGLRAPTMRDPRPPSTAYRRGGVGIGGYSHQYSHGPLWRGPSMKANVSSRKKTDRSRAQLQWMKGVTMKRKSSTPQRSLSKDSAMFSSQYNDKWGGSETVQEEFIRVTQRLPNITWISIDMENFSLVASLKGPWGENGETIYIKVQVNIPTTYPTSRAPKFSIERSMQMPQATYAKLMDEIHELAERFLKYKQNCLDVAFTYLLGEVDLESSKGFLKNVGNIDDLGGLVDESSSEDENEGIAPTSMSQELVQSTESARALLPQMNRPTTYIPPSLCGGRFANDGKLVCFFPSKERPKPFLFVQPELYHERSKDEPSFAGFGRIQVEPPVLRKIPDDTSATENDSEGPDESDVSTSSDSESTNIKTSVWFQPSAPRRLPKYYSESQSHRSSGGGTGIGTGTATGTVTSRRRLGRPRNVVSIYNMAHELPSKREFAKEYAIFGDGSEVCEHNAGVAAKYGQQDLANVWRYCGLLLRKDIPLEVLPFDQRRNSVLVIAKHVVARFRNPSVNSDSMMAHTASDNNLSGRVKWGHHPLAKDYIRDLFDYFEKIADVQMLAMLSCIFSESTTTDSIAYADAHLSQPETPLPMKAPSFSLDYFPAHSSAWALAYRSQLNSALATPRIAQTPLHLSGSPYAAEDYWRGDPGSNSFSCGETPPSVAKPGREYNSTEHFHTQSLSTSPDGRSFRQSNSSNLSGFPTSSVLATSLPKPSAGVVSSSPPTTKKRPSPAENFLSNLAPATLGNITWGNTTFLSEKMAIDGQGSTTRNSISDDELRGKSDDLLPLIPVGISVTMTDQNEFDDDGWLTTPLLEPRYASLYASYRHTYAEMLQMWKLPLSRLEVMKFNVLNKDLGAVNIAQNDMFESECYVARPSTGTSHGNGQITETAASSMLLGKREHLLATVASGRGLDVTGHCRFHETKLKPLQLNAENSVANETMSQSHHSRANVSSNTIVDAISATTAEVGGAVGTCDRCKRIQWQLTCVYCYEPIDSLYAACLGCGCVTHEQCLAEWHSLGEEECPAGDECKCVNECITGPIESWHNLASVLDLKGRTVLKGSDGKTARTSLMHGRVREAAERVTHKAKNHLQIAAVAALSNVGSSLSGFNGRRPKISISLTDDEADESMDNEEGNEILHGPTRLQTSVPSLHSQGSAMRALQDQLGGVNRHDTSYLVTDDQPNNLMMNKASRPTKRDGGGLMAKGGLDALQRATPADLANAGPLPQRSNGGPNHSTAMSSMARLSFGNRLRKAGEYAQAAVGGNMFGASGSDSNVAATAAGAEAIGTDREYLSKDGAIMFGDRPTLLRRRSGGAEVWKSKRPPTIGSELSDQSQSNRESGFSSLVSVGDAPPTHSKENRRGSHHQQRQFFPGAHGGG